MFIMLLQALKIVAKDARESPLNNRRTCWYLELISYLAKEDMIPDLTQCDRERALQ